MTLRGRGVLITGASQGLGRAIAQSCLRQGADLFLCARGAAQLEETRTELQAEAAKDQKVFAKAVDVSSLEQVSDLAQRAIEALPHLTGLVNNAGVHGPKGPIEDVDWQEWVQAIQINLFGTVLLCRALMPKFRQQKYGKMVNLSGGGATSPMPGISAYAASKAAVVRFTETLAEECKGVGIDVNAVAPGAMNTRLLDDVLAAGPEKVGAQYYQRLLKQKQDGGAPPSKAADLCAFLLASASDGITGRLISAVWDPWQTLPERRTDLERTDVYTLRRIVPQDRGLAWE